MKKKTITNISYSLSMLSIIPNLINIFYQVKILNNIITSDQANICLCIGITMLIIGFMFDGLKGDDE